jgi:hypothetical protein
VSLTAWAAATVSRPQRRAGHGQAPVERAASGLGDTADEHEGAEVERRLVALLVEPAELAHDGAEDVFDEPCTALRSAASALMPR